MRSIMAKKLHQLLALGGGIAVLGAIAIVLPGMAPNDYTLNITIDNGKDIPIDLIKLQGPQEIPVQTITPDASTYKTSFNRSEEASINSFKIKTETSPYAIYCTKDDGKSEITTETENVFLTLKLDEHNEVKGCNMKAHGAVTELTNCTGPEK